MSEYRPYDGCLGKRVYHTWAHAARDARSITDSGKSGPVVHLPYKCKICGKYHVGGTYRLKRRLRHRRMKS